MKDGKRGFEQKVSIRNRWPQGLIGSFQYFTDHVVCRYERPVDWTGLHALEEAFVPGYPVFAGGFAVLNDGEEAVFKLLGKEGKVEPVRVKLGLTEEELQKHLSGLKRLFAI